MNCKEGVIFTNSVLDLKNGSFIVTFTVSCIRFRNVNVENFTVESYHN